MTRVIILGVDVHYQVVKCARKVRKGVDVRWYYWEDIQQVQIDAIVDPCYRIMKRAGWI